MYICVVKCNASEVQKTVKESFQTELNQKYFKQDGNNRSNKTQI